ncbi:hypothetical protein MRB53_013518 [Persea americana]|uniref:Uncharacterized protein n=1 Tax=Persea americana TaxID=3435 RepID=A0ACC2K8M6_PERAE|nr:hypothetical protein MRB53_013518 [Persea americana]
MWSISGVGDWAPPTTTYRRKWWGISALSPDGVREACSRVLFCLPEKTKSSFFFSHLDSVNSDCSSALSRKFQWLIVSI